VLPPPQCQCLQRLFQRVGMPRIRLPSMARAIRRLWCRHRFSSPRLRRRYTTPCPPSLRRLSIPQGMRPPTAKRALPLIAHRPPPSMHRRLTAFRRAQTRSLNPRESPLTNPPHSRPPNHIGASMLVLPLHTEQTDIPCIICNETDICT
jgi:hypothetical protein